MNQKKMIIASLSLLFIILISAFVWLNTSGQYSSRITSFKECAAAGYPILESSPEQCKLPNGETYTRNIDSDKVITLTGRTTCLPHKNTDGPHTMECAIGIESENGNYYGINSEPYNTSLSEVGRTIKITGTLKDDLRSQYDSKGIITVTSYEFVEEKE